MPRCTDDRDMRRMLRLMLVLSVLVGAVWVSAAVEIRGKTPVGHALSWWKKQSFFAAKKERPKRKVDKKEAVRPAPKPVEKEATRKRVAILEKAAESLSVTPDPAVKKTKVGEKPSASEKKALDELVTSHLTNSSL
jgi:hypothetical protein